MKIKHLLTLTMSFYFLNSFTQEQLSIDGIHYSYESIPAVKNIFLESMEKPMNSSDPNLHPLLGSNWYYNSNNSDEFNGSSLNLNKWTINYKWGNTYLQHLAHNRQDLVNHEFDSNNLIIKNITENFSQKMIEYHTNSQIESDGKPNFRELSYTSAMIMSKNAPKNTLNQPYGFIEIRCKIPKSKYIMANFWLWSAGTDNNGKEFYNEIDVFEINDGITMHQTTHYFFEDYNINNWYHHHQIVWPEDATYFSDEMNTYAVKWEPNKIIYYLNNKVMRIITEHIPEHKMDIILDLAFRQENGQLSDLTLNPYIIDYIRVFNRSDYNKPDPVFNINNKISNNFNSPILIDENSTIIMNAEESYSINNAYFISIQEVNSSNQGIGNEVSTWLLNTTLDDINSFDIKNFCLTNGLTLNTNSVYKIKLVAGGGDWIENNQYLKITPHENSVNFTINGSNNLVVNIKNVLSYQEIPRIILNGSKSTLSGDDFFISVEPSNINWSTTGPEISKWYLNQPNKLKEFDLRSFAGEEGLDLEYGAYYKIKLCTANPWTCETKLIYIEPCENHIDFEINGINTQLITITSEFNQPDILLTTAQCNSCFSDDYHISVQNSNANGQAIGTEVHDWMIPPNEFSHISSKIDLREFTSSRGLNFINGNYYLVKVSTANPWTEKSKLLYIDNCTSNPEFTIEGQYGTISNPVEITCEANPKVRLSAWNGTACDNMYFLSLWNCDNQGNCTEIANQWLPPELVDNMKNTNYTSLAYYNLYDHFQNSPFNTSLSGYNFYKISLCTGFDGWKCNDVYIHMNQPDCGYNKIIKPKRNIQNNKYDSYYPFCEIYPNPTSDILTVRFSDEYSSEKKISITNSLGEVVFHTSTNEKIEMIDLTDMANGLYNIRIQTDGVFTTEKLIKQ